MKKLAITLLALFCAACTSTSGPFIGDRDHKEVVITWVRTPPVMVGTICEQKLGRTYGYDLAVMPPGTADATGMFSPRACAVYGVNSLGKASCTIYAAVPESDYGIEILGHEALHCFIGEWHY